MTPLLEPETVATPPENVIVVAVPKSTWGVIVSFLVAPAVCVAEPASTSFAGEAGFTVKLLEVPVSEPPVLVAVTVAPEPAWVRVSEWLAKTPAVKAAEVVQPAEQVLLELTSTAPVKPAAVLSN